MRQALVELKHALSKFSPETLDKSVRSVEIIFVIGVLYFVFVKTANIITLLFFLALVALYFLTVLNRCLLEVDEGDPTGEFYVRLSFQLVASVIGVASAVWIAVDFAKLQ